MNSTRPSQARGFSLIEALVAVVVLSFGLLSLAALQSGLFRAGAEAKARSNAMAIAQDALESARSFAYTQRPVPVYDAHTYTSLSTGAIASTAAGGVTYKGCRQVVRYVYDQATRRFVAANTVSYSASASGGNISVTCSETVVQATPFDPARPEFKQVSVAVVWPGDVGQVKTVQVTDTVSSVSPSDSVMVLKAPDAGLAGPSIHITPPSGTGVVPIAIGTNESGEEIAAASSNPKPKQFVDDMSAVTNFTVQTFSGDASSDRVLLNRQQQVSVASCICSTTSEKSSSTRVAYGPTTWNGKQFAYTEPKAIVGKPIGNAVVAASDSEIKTVCTTCCRDHHDGTRIEQPLRFDPYRTPDLVESTNGDHKHFGYRKSGNAYDLSTPVPAGPDTGNQYIEACRLVRVNGRLRVAVDSRMNYLSVIPMNAPNGGLDPPTDFQDPAFVETYSAFVADYIKEALGAIPVGYPSVPLADPTDQLRKTNPYRRVVDSPGTFQFTDETTNRWGIDIATGGKRHLVDFGLYIDHLTPDTIEAYRCALANDNTGDCEGYGNRNPLEFIPFYAVNVANLGYWNSERPDLATVSNVRYNNQGGQVGDGGIVTGVTGSLPKFGVAESIRRGNSGLTNTAATDSQDSAEVVLDQQLFRKVESGTGTGNVTLAYVTIHLVLSSSAQLKLDLGRPDAPDACVPFDNGNSWRCGYNVATTDSITLTARNYSKPGANRELCVPANVARINHVGDGTRDESVDIRLSNLGGANWTLRIQVRDESAGACSSDLTYTSP